jgi:hypothetical protein
MYFVKFQDHEGQHSFNFEPDDKLTVYWLPQPEREEAAAPLLPQTVEGAVQKRARHNSRFTIGQQVKHWDQLHESAPDEKPYTVTGKDGVMHDIEEVGSPTNRKTVHEAYIYEIEEREEAAVREFADGWRDAEVARLTSELEAAKVEMDLRGEFLSRVVDIRSRLIDQRSNSWLDSIDAIGLEIARLQAEVARLNNVIAQITDVMDNGPFNKRFQAIDTILSTASEPDHK